MKKKRERALQTELRGREGRERERSGDSPALVNVSDDRRMRMRNRLLVDRSARSGNTCNGVIIRRHLRVHLQKSLENLLEARSVLRILMPTIFHQGHER